jgi:hypothetical protein
MRRCLLGVLLLTLPLCVGCADFLQDMQKQYGSGYNEGKARIAKLDGTRT